uniref:CW-type domain-containing protein n=1 Tax=Pyxicephalus adspersus TaxID=30357 RepID=A0AAV3BC23_PYXAD|nr:TPA: hypothetical protein GDO54_002058 [Pyxicephalus adspersus]
MARVLPSNWSHVVLEFLFVLVLRMSWALPSSVFFLSSWHVTQSAICAVWDRVTFQEDKKKTEEKTEDLNPKFLHTNSTSHTWPFGAIAEILDNAYDPDVNAKQIWIDKTVLNNETCLTFTDNGKGMTADKLHKMLSFRFSNKIDNKGHLAVGLYGNGFKSGSMRLGKDAIVFTKNDSGMHVGMLSQTFLEKINAESVIVPIISFDKQNILFLFILVRTSDCEASLNAILEHSLKIGCTEFDFETDPYDIKIPEENDKTYKQDRNGQVAPESDYSLRDQSVTMTFGFNCQNKQHYGIMMYHRNRLIKSYVRVGCQLKDNYMGIGVVGIIECNFLRPTHNKQDFIYTREYRLTLSALGSKLDDYWVEKKEKLKTVTVGFLEKEKKPDQTWVQCDQCLKWRKLPDGIGKLPEKWYCHMNPDPQFRDCNVPEEPEDDEEITQPTYEKTHKKKRCEELSVKVKHLEDQLAVALGQQVEKETSQAYIQTDPVPTQDKSRELLLSQYEQAVEEVHQLKILCNTLQARKAEPEASQVELLKQQKLQTDAEIVKLKTEVEQLIKETQNAASASTSFAERTKLWTLRINVARLLTILMPDMNLGQIDYEVDVIDDILQQVLEQEEKQRDK